MACLTGTKQTEQESVLAVMDLIQNKLNTLLLPGKQPVGACGRLVPR